MTHDLSGGGGGGGGVKIILKIQYWNKSLAYEIKIKKNKWLQKHGCRMASNTKHWSNSHKQTNRWRLRKHEQQLL